MSAKNEWTLLAVLAIVSVGGYRSLEKRAAALPPDIAVPSDEANREASGVPAGMLPDAPVLTAQPLDEVSASFSRSGLPDSGQWRGQSVFADVNHDGHPDLITSIRRWDRSTPADGLKVFLGGADGNWTESVEGTRRDMGYGGSEVLDLDNDGHLDIVFSGHDVTPHVFLGNGDGTWNGAERLDIDFISSDVAAGDCDGDGNADLAVLGFYPGEGGLVYFRGDGAGGFERFAELLPRANYGAEVEFADLDGDGRMEIIAVTDLGLKSWAFDDELEWVEMSEGLPTPAIGGSELAIAVADIDGDGYREIVRAGMSYDGHSPLAVYRRSGDQWHEYGAGLPADETYFDACFAQLDEDPAQELVLAGKWGLTILRSSPSGQFERLGRVAGTEGVINVCAADLNGDGRDELASIGFGGPRIYTLADLRQASEAKKAQE